MSESADKRSVATDALKTLGTIIGADEKRDAIHLAVEPVIAAENLRPGDDVGFMGAGGIVGKCDKPLGIVDPFLRHSVKTGERFWLIVYPRQITSLRHVWEHPEFPASELTQDSRKQVEETLRELNAALLGSRVWMRRFADQFGKTPEELLAHAREFIEQGEYWNEGLLFDGEYVPDEFWTHYEAITGESVAEENRGSFFSCSC